MKIPWLLLCIPLFYSPNSLARECKSCQEHRNGGSITYGNNYTPGGVYQSGGTYYPGGVYPGYSNNYGAYPNNRYNGYRGGGSLTQTCGYGSVSGDHKLSGNGCVTRYRGPASDINQLPRITRKIHQSQPHSFNNPWKRPAAVPLKR
ncbi:MAG: hypothetical protein U9N50_04630 [Pseudomonadota bacterium]|nr:hypothetical protein [Pseudomonadota bacterium]